MTETAADGESRELFASILDAVAEAITVVSADGRLVYANAPALALLGYASADELLVASSDEVLGRFEREVPMRRLGEPREFAALVAFLASERASYITGTSVQVDGGWVRSLL